MVEKTIEDKLSNKREELEKTEKAFEEFKQSGSKNLENKINKIIRNISPELLILLNEEVSKRGISSVADKKELGNINTYEKFLKSGISYKDLREKLNEIISNFTENNQQEKSEETKEKNIDIKKQNFNENTEKIVFFGTKFLENKIREILNSQKAIKEIKELSVSGEGEELILRVKLVAKKIRTIEVSFRAHLINTQNGIRLDEIFTLEATKFKIKIRDLIIDYINSVNEKIKEFIEKELGEKVEKIWIKNGRLNVTKVSKELNDKDVDVGKISEDIKNTEEEVEKNENTEKIEEGLTKEEQKLIDEIRKEAEQEKKEIEELNNQVISLMKKMGIDSIEDLKRIEKELDELESKEPKKTSDKISKEKKDDIEKAKEVLLNKYGVYYPNATGKKSYRVLSENGVREEYWIQYWDEVGNSKILKGGFKNKEEAKNYAKTKYNIEILDEFIGVYGFTDTNKKLYDVELAKLEEQYKEENGNQKKQKFQEKVENYQITLDDIYLIYPDRDNWYSKFKEEPERLIRMKKEDVEELKLMVKRVSMYIKGKIMARELICTAPYRYISKNINDKDAKKYAEEAVAKLKPILDKINNLK